MTRGPATVDAQPVGARPGQDLHLGDRQPDVRPGRPQERGDEAAQLLLVLLERRVARTGRTFGQGCSSLLQAVLDPPLRAQRVRHPGTVPCRSSARNVAVVIASLLRFLRIYREVYAQEHVEQERRRARPRSAASAGFWSMLCFAWALNAVDAVIGLEGGAWDGFRMVVGLVWVVFAVWLLRDHLDRWSERRRAAPAVLRRDRRPSP